MRITRGWRRNKYTVIIKVVRLHVHSLHGMLEWVRNQGVELKYTDKEGT